VNLPTIVEAVRPVPVLASGGIATGRGVAAALMLGAQGVSMGTRLAPTHEAFASDEYKNRIVNARAEDTVYVDLFDGGFGTNAPHRVIRNKIVDEWGTARQATERYSSWRGHDGRNCESRGGKDAAGARYYSSLVTPEYEGDLEYAPLWCEESCTLVHDIKPAAEVVQQIVDEAAAALSKWRVKSESSPRRPLTASQLAALRDRGRE
jgi:NAD(P)H-dependent flavin oxidoreductase YrpB (nitropropane dioxygenase family)